jgi:hypothetical protein
MSKAFSLDRAFFKRSQKMQNGDGECGFAFHVICDRLLTDGQNGQTGQGSLCSSLIFSGSSVIKLDSALMIFYLENQKMVTLFHN